MNKRYTSVPKYVAVCPRTGAHLRDATADEAAAYLAQPVRHPAFRTPIMVGAVLVECWTGYGVSHAGAGF